jgi:dihydrofolate reductase
MRSVRYSVAMSLDGYIAGPNGEYDWIVMDPEIAKGFPEQFKRYDTMLIGRKSFAAAGGQGGGGMFSGMKVVVCSSTLKPGDHKGVTIAADAAAAVRQLRQEPGKDIWLFGGGSLFRSLLDAGLVDAVEVAVIPVLLGGGIPLLPAPASRATLTLALHRVYPATGTAWLEYRVDEKASGQPVKKTRSRRSTEPMNP